MTDAMQWMLTAGLCFVGTIIVVFAGLKAWHGWLELKRLELSGRQPVTIGERIEIADLRERVRKLEAIAACVDL